MKTKNVKRYLFIHILSIHIFETVQQANLPVKHTVKYQQSATFEFGRSTCSNMGVCACPEQQPKSEMTAPASRMNSSEKTSHVL